ncbi:TolB family protein [Aestuariivivens sediminis]|uniref:TolB family protein n=1 Tax=Aestuariivivens sediminis TaxID=2913557 RepID=UPI003B8A72A3
MTHLNLLGILLINSIVFSQSQLAEPYLPGYLKEFPNVRDLTMSPDGNEIMFTAQSVMGNLSAIISLKKENNVWGKLQIAPFSGKYFDLEPCFSKDGLRLYFVSTRPLFSHYNDPKDFDIWYTERQSLNSEWSEPKNMEFPINTEHGEFYPSLSKNGNLYFTRDNTTLKRKDDIYFSEYDNGGYSEPVALSDSINSEGYEYNAFIAPDESYLIFGCYNRTDGYGSGDLYISYNIGNQWTKAKNMGDTINSDKMDYCPFVDTKTNTLYFTSKRDNTNAQFDNPVNLEELLIELNRYDNGSSRLYKIDFSPDDPHEVLKKDD